MKCDKCKTFIREWQSLFCKACNRADYIAKQGRENTQGLIRSDLLLD